MTKNNAVSALAGLIIMLTLFLNDANIFNEISWTWMTFFVGFNLFQSAFSGFCPAAKIFGALGLK